MHSSTDVCNQMSKYSHDDAEKLYNPDYEPAAFSFIAYI